MVQITKYIQRVNGNGKTDKIVIVNCIKGKSKVYYYFRLKDCIYLKQ